MEFLRALPETDACIIWPYGTSHGYGKVSFNAKEQTAHRVALILARGQDPEHLEAAHGPCHNRLCVNPAHLSWKTRKENAKDMVRDGSTRFAPGELNAMRKLTVSQVIAIRNDPRTQELIAADYSIGQTAVSKIKTKATWSWLCEPEST